MALPETSPLEDSLARLLANPNQPAAQAANPINYGLTTPGSLDTTTSLGAEQPYTDPAAATATPTIPATPATPETPTTPTMSQADYEAQKRAEYAAAGIPESALDFHVAGAVAGEYPTYDNYYNLYSAQGFKNAGQLDSLARSGVSSAGVTDAAAINPSASFQPIATPTPSSNTYNGVRYTVSKDSSGKPINPGPKAAWQFSQQYWKDLANYEARKK